jgi:hypothetical protein
MSEKEKKRKEKLFEALIQNEWQMINATSSKTKYICLALLLIFSFFLLPWYSIAFAL